MRSLRAFVATVACLVLAAAIVLAVTGPRHVARAPARPNIVFVLTDDLSMDLLRYMPHVQGMERRGLTFTNYFVSDSLCCPSRASIFTGDFPHNTHIFRNIGRHGGFKAFQGHGDGRRSFALALSSAGYRTAMMGKYLNGYLQRANGPPTADRDYVPAGWSEWDVAGWGYPEFDYTLEENGALHAYGHRPSDYLTDVLTRKGVDFIARSARSGRPFFLELGTFSPHSPYVAAPRDVGAFAAAADPRPASFGRLPSDPPRWLARRPPLNARKLARLDDVFRRRVEAVQSVDRMLAAIEHALAANGLARDTYVVFSSDNGLHAGQYRLMPGKMTAFDSDIRVPLVVVGPDVPPGAETRAMTENVDLAKTFAAIAGRAIPGDGHSLLPLFSGERPLGWRDAVLVEHHGRVRNRRDPDRQRRASGDPPTYDAMRTHRFLYVEYADGEREFYDVRRDPSELHNLASGLSRRARARLHGQLAALARCHGGRACWAAAHVNGRFLSASPARRHPSRWRPPRRPSPSPTAQRLTARGGTSRWWAVAVRRPRFARSAGERPAHRRP